MRLAGKVAVVTGGAQGIGRAYCEGFAREGAAVVVVDLRGEQAEATAGALRAGGARAAAHAADVADQAAMDGVAAAVEREFGRIDVLVNNAAIYHDLGDQSLAYLRRILDVNLLGVLVCARAVFPAMKRQRAGSIINISSGAAYPDRLQSPVRELETVPSFAYGLAKSGVVYYTKAMARARPVPHPVNAIAPGSATGGVSPPHRRHAVAPQRATMSRGGRTAAGHDRPAPGRPPGPLRARPAGCAPG
jgi:NAD(P)-dependent dehydrogenase (short-subunit alcohol dehydrogenase family)